MRRSSLLGHKRRDLAPRAVVAVSLDRVFATGKTLPDSAGNFVVGWAVVLADRVVRGGGCCAQGVSVARMKRAGEAGGYVKGGWQGYTL
jgi:hypothetical protein